MNNSKQSFDIGIFSWNAGLNFTDETMTQMLNEILRVENNGTSSGSYLYNDNKLPDFIVLGFQEIPYKYKKDYKEFKDEGKVESPNKRKWFGHEEGTLYVAEGLKKLLENNSKLRGTHTWIGGGEVCTYNKLFNFNRKFGISIVVFAKNEISDDWTVIKQEDSKCGGVKSGKTENFSKTKGTLIMSLVNKNDSEHSIYLTCSHFPFSQESDIKDYLMDIHKFTINKDSICFGDLNSRSVIIEDLGKLKSIPLCSSQASKGTSISKDMMKGQSATPSDPRKFNEYCHDIVEQLESIPYEETYGEAPDKYSDLISRLLQTDVLKQIMRQTKFREHPISFLPTYKRSIMENDLGRFELFKRSDSDSQKIKAGRYPGYADRIIYTDGCLKCYKYTSLNLRGNDHLPIYAKFKWDYNRCNNEKMYGLEKYKDIYNNLKTHVWLRYLKEVSNESIDSQIDEKFKNGLAILIDNDYQIYDPHETHNEMDIDDILISAKELFKEKFGHLDLSKEKSGSVDLAWNDLPETNSLSGSNHMSEISGANELQYETSVGGGKRKSKRKILFRKKNTKTNNKQKNHIKSRRGKKNTKRKH